MSYSNANKVRFEPLREIANGDISSSYSIFGDPFDNPIRQIKFVNGTDAIIKVSFDGDNDNDVYLPMSGGVFDYATNRQAMGDNFEQNKFTQMYVLYEGAAPTTGSFYAVLIYADTV